MTVFLLLTVTVTHTVRTVCTNCTEIQSEFLRIPCGCAKKLYDNYCLLNVIYVRLEVDISLKQCS